MLHVQYLFCIDDYRIARLNFSTTRIRLIRTTITTDTTNAKDSEVEMPTENAQNKTSIKVRNIVYFHHDITVFNFAEKCWFCLSSTSVEKHLVITVGEHFYLALAKGPINETHCLILPVTHIQCSALLSKESWVELDQFKDALRKMFKSKQSLLAL